MNATLIQKPTFYPVDLDMLAAFLRVEENEDMPLIRSFLQTAVDKAETITGRKLSSQQWRLDLPYFEQNKAIPYPPLISVDSVQYYNDQNVLTTLAAAEYEVYEKNKVSFIKSAHGYSSPSAYDRQDAIQITFTCGYATQNDVPDGIKNALSSIVWHMYDDRAASLTDSQFRFLLAPYILRGF